MSGIDLEITLQDAKLIAGLLRAAGEQRKFTSEVDKTKRSSQQAEKELDRMAEAVKRMTATPLEKYNKELGKLDVLLQKSKISEQEHTRAVALQRAELDKATIGTQKLGRATDDLGAGSKHTFLEIAGSMGLVTTGAGAAALAVQKIGEAWSYAADQAKRAAEQMDTQQDARRTLNQVAESPEDLDRILTLVGAMAEKHSVPIDTAARVFADTRGGGFEQEYEQMLVGHAGVLDSRDASFMTKKVKSIYGDQVKNLSGKNIVDMALAAAQPSDVEFQDLAKVIPGAAEGGALVGSSYTETASATSVLAGKFKNVDSLGDRLKGFGVRASMDERMKGKGYLGAMRVLRDEMGEEERSKWLGESQELNIAYNMLSGSEEQILARMKHVDAARIASQQGRGEVQKGAQRALDSKMMGPSIKKQGAEIARDNAAEIKLAPFEQLQRQTLAEIEHRNLDRNMTGVQRGWSWMMGRVAMAVGAGPEAMKYWSGDAAADRFYGKDPAAAKRAEDTKKILEDQKAAADMQKQAATMNLQSAQQLASHARSLTRHNAMNVEAMQAIS